MARTKAYANTPDLAVKTVGFKVKASEKNGLKDEARGTYEFASGSSIEHALSHAKGNEGAVVAGYFQWVNSVAKAAAREELLTPGKSLNSMAKAMVDKGFAADLDTAKRILEAAKAGNI